MKMSRTVAAVVTAGALLTGLGATTAFAADARRGPGPGRGSPAIGKNLDCSKADEVKATLDHTKSGARPDPLRAHRAAERVEDDREPTPASPRSRPGSTSVIAKLAERDPKVGARIDKLEQRIDAKCSTGQ